MDLGLRGRVAIVAAASKGLGRAVAEELAHEGAHIAICSREAKSIEGTAIDIQASTKQPVFWRAVDVRQEEAIAAFVADVEKEFGRVDICVTNSGGPPSNSFADTKVEDWRVAVDQLLMSTVSFARETLPRMKRNNWGRFITITSSAVKQPVDGLLLSNSLRAAVAGLARTLANEYAAFGITVNNVCPGYTRTHAWIILRKVFPRDQTPQRKRSSPAGLMRFPQAASERRRSLPLWLHSSRPSAPAT